MAAVLISLLATSSRGKIFWQDSGHRLKRDHLTGIVDLMFLFWFELLFALSEVTGSIRTLLCWCHVMLVFYGVNSHKVLLGVLIHHLPVAVFDDGHIRSLLWTFTRFVTLIFLLASIVLVVIIELHCCWYSITIFRIFNVEVNILLIGLIWRILLFWVSMYWTFSSFRFFSRWFFIMFSIVSVYPLPVVYILKFLRI